MRVLIVDDEDGALFRDKLVAWGTLDETRDTVRVETSLEGASRALNASRGWPDLIVLDAYFPERDGQLPQFMAHRVMALLAERPSARNPKVILVSGHRDVHQHWNDIVEWFDRSVLEDVLPKTDLNELTFILLAKRVEMLRKLLSFNLSPRRQEVLALIAEGCSNGKIALQLGIKLATVKVLVSQVFDALGVTNRFSSRADGPQDGHHTDAQRQT